MSHPNLSRSYIRDEKELLDLKVKEVSTRDPDLAFFIWQYQWRRGRFDEGHIGRLQKMVKKLGSKFTGTLEPGTRLAPPEAAHTPETVPAESQPEEMETDAEWDDEDEEDGWEDEQGEEEEDEEIAEMMETVLTLATD
ncbi:hypothetical protein B0H14DRAFT_3445885 [Mycena olivaceomarginata]|nr:hypothetical protein B0H14DRAFT_3445885 [Mycena olivaceomarginata]